MACGQGKLIMRSVSIAIAALRLRRCRCCTFKGLVHSLDPASCRFSLHARGQDDGRDAPVANPNRAPNPGLPFEAKPHDAPSGLTGPAFGNGAPSHARNIRANCLSRST